MVYTYTIGMGIGKEIMSAEIDKTTVALKKAHTLLGKIIKMKEDREYCIAIMQQNLAVIGLLKSAQQQLMTDHLGSCFKNAMNSQNEKRKNDMIEEILRVTTLSNK